MMQNAKKPLGLDQLLAAERAKMTCTKRQAYIVLSEDVCAALDAMADDPAQPWELRQTLKYATVWERNLPVINDIGAALGYSADQIDALFIAAMQVE